MEVKNKNRDAQLKRALTSQNSEFWQDLCGSWLAKKLGIVNHSVEELNRFDEAYLDLYPYLTRHVPIHEMKGKRVLEVGLGYGTLSQKIFESGAIYTGLDISPGPVNMVEQRLKANGVDGTVIESSMLDCPLESASQDYVISIGCFHHTGDIQGCLMETYRVLKPGGKACIMVYNQFSYRQWLRWPVLTLKALTAKGNPMDSSFVVDSQRKAYDSNTDGDGAPETVFVSVSQLTRMLSKFTKVQIQKENCIHLSWRGKSLFPRKVLLSTLGRISGLDLYVYAEK